MSIVVSVGDLVQVQFPVFDVDGITPVTGLADGVFGKLLAIDDTPSALTVVVVEVGSGIYEVEFTPNSAGLWYVQVETPSEDVFMCHIQAGPPPADWTAGISDDVWSKILPGTFPVDSAGERLSQTSDDAALVRQALVMANLTAVVPGSTVGVIQTGATQVDDFYNGLMVVVRNAGGSVSRRITDYAQVDGVFTIDRDLPFVPVNGDQVIVLGILGEVVFATDSLALGKLSDIHNIMGLDSEDPLCVSKSGQVTKRITIKHTEVGQRVIVQREV